MEPSLGETAGCFWSDVQSQADQGWGIDHGEKSSPPEKKKEGTFPWRLRGIV